MEGLGKHSVHTGVLACYCLNHAGYIRMHMFGKQTVSNFTGGLLVAASLAGSSLSSAQTSQPDTPLPPNSTSNPTPGENPSTASHDLSPLPGASVSVNGAAFIGGSRAVGLHVTISNKVNRRQKVTLKEIADLYKALSAESGNKLPAEFFERYDKAFGDPRVTKIISDYRSASTNHREKGAEGAKKTAGNGKFRATDNTPIPAPEDAFAPNSQASLLHAAINRSIQSGRPVTGGELRALFSEFSRIDVQKIPPGFFGAYADKFHSTEAIQIMITSMIPAPHGERALPRGLDNFRRVIRMHELVKHLPVETSIDQKRVFFRSFKTEQDLGVRALGLALCLTLNINPGNDFKPSEIVRASQLLISEQRILGDEFRLGCMLADALESSGLFGVDTDTFNQIKMAVLRRGQTAERRYPGITAALSSDEAVYIAYLEEHAKDIISKREAIAHEVVLAPGVALRSVIHSDPKISGHPQIDVARAFRLNFDPGQHMVKGSTDPHNPGPEKRYHGLFDELRATTPEAGVVFWEDTHGFPDGAVFHSAQAEQVITSIQDGNALPLQPTQVITPVEAADLILRVKDPHKVTIINNTCFGWDYHENINECILNEHLKRGLSETEVIEQVRLPRRIIASQNGMLSIGFMVTWIDDTLPTYEQRPKEIEYAEIGSKLMEVCQSEATGIAIDALTEIGPKDEPFRCTWDQIFDTDRLLERRMRSRHEEYWRASEGTPHKELNRSVGGLDASLQDGKLQNFDDCHHRNLDAVREKGLTVPDYVPTGEADRRITDHVVELG